MQGRVKDTTKGLTNNKASCVDSMINEFLKYDSFEVRDKLLKIMNITFEKVAVS